MTRFPRGALSATPTFRARFKHGGLGALRGGAAAARGPAAAAAGRGGRAETVAGGDGGEGKRRRRAAPRAPLRMTGLLLPTGEMKKGEGLLRREEERRTQAG